MDKLALDIQGQGVITPPPGVPTGGTGMLNTIIQNSLVIAFIIAIVLALFFLIFSGIQRIVAGGDKQKLEAARKRIIFVIVGLVIVLLAFFILNLVGGFFSLNLLGK